MQLQHGEQGCAPAKVGGCLPSKGPLTVPLKAVLLVSAAARIPWWMHRRPQKKCPGHDHHQIHCLYPLWQHSFANAMGNAFHFGTGLCGSEQHGGGWPKPGEQLEGPPSQPPTSFLELPGGHQLPVGGAYWTAARRALPILHHICCLQAALRWQHPYPQCVVQRCRHRFSTVR